MEVSDPNDALLLVRGDPSQPPRALRLTREQVLYARSLLATGDEEESLKASGLSKEASKEFRARPEIQQYLQERLLEGAAAAGLTKDKVLARIAELVESPASVASPAHLQALNMAAKILSLIKPTQNIQQTFVQNPLAEKSDEEIDKEMKARLEYRQKTETK